MCRGGLLFLGSCIFPLGPVGAIYEGVFLLCIWLTRIGAILSGGLCFAGVCLPGCFPVGPFPRIEDWLAINLVDPASCLLSFKLETSLLKLLLKLLKMRPAIEEPCL